MAFPIRVPCYGFKALHHGQNQNSIIPKDCNDLAPGIALRPTTLCARNFSTMKVSFYRHIDRFLLHAVSGDGQGSANSISESNAQNWPAENEGSVESASSRQRGFPTSAEILEQLKRYGISGILAYGILNTAYYSITFLLVWFYFAPAPGKMGYLAAVERFFKVMAMVWAGSQVTKLLRAGGALALAPFVDRGLTWFTERFNFESRGKAFLTIVGFCLGVALVIFVAATFLSA